MKIFFYYLLVTIMLFSYNIFYCQNGPDSSKTIGKLPVPAIDGKINDAEWAGAKVFTSFYITVPKSDEKYYDSTIVYVKQTADAMYFGFKYWPKGKVICQSLNRDVSTKKMNSL